eukprot:IDg6866t1
MLIELFKAVAAGFYALGNLKIPQHILKANPSLGAVLSQELGLAVLSWRTRLVNLATPSGISHPL